MIIEVSNSLVSTVSQKISALERELGVQLLERTTRTFRGNGERSRLSVAVLKAPNGHFINLDGRWTMEYMDP